MNFQTKSAMRTPTRIASAGRLLLVLALAFTFISSPRAAQVKIWFVDPFTGLNDTNYFLASQISSNILANGGVQGIGVARRLQPDSSGFVTNYFGIGFYSITDPKLGAAIVIQNFDSGQTQFDYTNLLHSGYNTYINSTTIINTNAAADLSAASNNVTSGNWPVPYSAVTGTPTLGSIASHNAPEFQTVTNPTLFQASGNVSVGYTNSNTIGVTVFHLGGSANIKNVRYSSGDEATTFFGSTNISGNFLDFGRASTTGVRLFDNTSSGLTISNGVLGGNGGNITGVPLPVNSTNNFASLTNANAQTFSGVNNFTNAGNNFVGSFNGNLTGGNGVTTNTVAYQFTTNFFTRNTKFVDAGNGSDANSGDVNYPWATIGHAQTNTPNGFTLAFAPGTYAGMITNFNFSCYLSSGATVVFDTEDALGFTNAVYGDGNVQCNAIGSQYTVDSSFTQTWTVHCADFSAKSGSSPIYYYDQEIYNIFCDTCFLTIDGNNPADYFSSVDRFNIYCNSTANLDKIADGDEDILLCCFAKTIIVSDGDAALSQNSILSAKTCITQSTTTFNNQGTSFTWDVGFTYCNGSPLYFSPGMVFLNNPMFDNNISVGTVKGAYQVQ